MRSVALIALVGCGGAAHADSTLTGKVTVAGKPVDKAEILVVRAGKVVATTTASPSFTLPAMTQCKDVTVVARLADPIGVVSAPVPASCKGAIAIDVPAGKVVEITAVIKPPLDWLDVRLTPELPNIAPTIVLADGTTSNLQEALWSQHVTTPSFKVRAIAGTWRLAAYHELDAPGPAFKVESVTANGKPLPTKLGAFEVELVAPAAALELSTARAH